MAVPSITLRCHRLSLFLRSPKNSPLFKKGFYRCSLTALLYIVLTVANSFILFRTLLMNLFHHTLQFPHSLTKELQDGNNINFGPSRYFNDFLSHVQKVDYKIYEFFFLLHHFNTKTILVLNEVCNLYYLLPPEFCITTIMFFATYFILMCRNCKKLQYFLTLSSIFIFLHATLYVPQYIEQPITDPLLFWYGSHAIPLQRGMLFYQNYHTIEL